MQEDYYRLSKRYKQETINLQHTISEQDTELEELREQVKDLEEKVRASFRS